MEHINSVSAQWVEAYKYRQLGLTKSQSLIYETLKMVALRVAEVRGYSSKVSQVTFHCPAEIVAFALGIHRSTLYRNIPTLRDAGMIDQRGHHTTLNGRTRCDGSLWSVKINCESKKPARISFEDMKHSWRFLASDIEQGHTAYAKIKEMQQSNTEKKDEVDLDLILEFTLPRKDLKPPLSMTVAQDLETVLDVAHVGREDRAEMVNMAAESVVTALGDQGSLNFYRWLLWQLLRLSEYQQKNYFYQVYLMLQRVRADKKEEFANSAGALFVSRLKSTCIWDELKNAPPYRVRLRTVGHKVIHGNYV